MLCEGEEGVLTGEGGGEVDWFVDRAVEVDGKVHYLLRGLVHVEVKMM